MAELEGSETASTEAACVAAAEGSGPNEEQLGLVAKRKTVALVWKHFGLEADESRKSRSPDRPKCRLCDMEVSAKCAITSILTCCKANLFSTTPIQSHLALSGVASPL